MAGRQYFLLIVQLFRTMIKSFKSHTNSEIHIGCQITRLASLFSHSTVSCACADFRDNLSVHVYRLRAVEFQSRLVTRFRTTRVTGHIYSNDWTSCNSIPPTVDIKKDYKM